MKTMQSILSAPKAVVRAFHREAAQRQSERIKQLKVGTPVIAWLDNDVQFETVVTRQPWKIGRSQWYVGLEGLPMYWVMRVEPK